MYHVAISYEYRFLCAAGHFYESVFSQALEICAAKRLSFIDANRGDAANWRVRFIPL